MRYIKVILKQNNGVVNDLAYDKYSEVHVSHFAALWGLSGLTKM